VHLASMDDDYVHLATEEQVDRIIAKYWSGVSKFIVLKVKSAELEGNLVLETNPGGTTLFYHLYNGSIPLSAVAESEIRSGR
jgi:uncharacterized protein (DUF952 family)